MFLLEPLITATIKTILSVAIYLTEGGAYRGWGKLWDLSYWLAHRGQPADLVGFRWLVSAGS